MQHTGRMRERIDILTLTEGANGYRWQADGRRWAEVIPGKRSIFSSVAMAARAVTVRLRLDRGLTLRHALGWRGQHLFLTRITHEPGQLYMTAEAALVRVSDCAVRRTTVTVDAEYNRPALGDERVVHFPAVLSERYLTQREEMPQHVNTDRMVLTCPHAVHLAPGEVVTVDGDAYVVQVAHELDPDRRDYEIVRREEA